MPTPGSADHGGLASSRVRDRMVERIRELGVRDPRVLDAMRAVPRHLFVDEALASRAYEDTALPIGFGQTISQPYIVARMTEAILAGGPINDLLEIGTGSGYQTAVVARLVRRVYSVERIEGLLALARERLRELGLRSVRLKHSDGTIGLPEYAPFDAILVTAAPEVIPNALLEQLKPGGRMVLPAGGREEQRLLRITRTARGFAKEVLERVAFVPLLGGVQ